MNSIKCNFNSDFVCSMNVNKKNQLFDSTTSVSSNTTSLPTHSTTHRAYYPDTFSPGAIAGVAVCSFLLLFFISMGTYYIRRQQLFYLPYYNNYRPI